MEWSTEKQLDIGHFQALLYLCNHRELKRLAKHLHVRYAKTKGATIRRIPAQLPRNTILTMTLQISHIETSDSGLAPKV